MNLLLLRSLSMTAAVQMQTQAPHLCAEAALGQLTCCSRMSAQHVHKARALKHSAQCRGSAEKGGAGLQPLQQAM